MPIASTLETKSLPSSSSVGGVGTLSHKLRVEMTSHDPMRQGEPDIGFLNAEGKRMSFKRSPITTRFYSLTCICFMWGRLHLLAGITATCLIWMELGLAW